MLRPACIKELRYLEPAETCLLHDTLSFQDFWQLRETPPTARRSMSSRWERTQETQTSQQLQLSTGCMSPSGGKHLNKQSKEQQEAEKYMYIYVHVPYVYGHCKALIYMYIYIMCTTLVGSVEHEITRDQSQFVCML